MPLASESARHSETCNLMLAPSVILASTPKMVVHHALGKEKEQCDQQHDKEEFNETDPRWP